MSCTINVSSAVYKYESLLQQRMYKMGRSTSKLTILLTFASLLFYCLYFILFSSALNSSICHLFFFSIWNSWGLYLCFTSLMIILPFNKYGENLKSNFTSESIHPRIFSIEDWDVLIFMLIHYLPCHMIIQIIVECKLLSRKYWNQRRLKISISVGIGKYTIFT